MTKDEKARLENFNKTSKDLIDKGYEVSERSMGVLKANILTIVIFIPLAYFLTYIYGRIHSPIDYWELIYSRRIIILAIMALILTLVHELLHGLTWAFFTPNGVSDIAFGFIWKYLSPYSSCKVPLQRGEYLLGVVMPLLVLGVIPAIVGIVIGNIILTLIGSLFIVGAGADVFMAIMLISYKPKRKDILVFDNPTKLGVKFFEK